MRTLALPLFAALALAGCPDRCAVPGQSEREASMAPRFDEAPNGVDILFAIDNSDSMATSQAIAARDFAALLDGLLRPSPDPRTGQARGPVTGLHLGVISTDLGTPGTVVPSCDHTDEGDNGLLNPIRHGASLRAHPPWTTAPPGLRPARCGNDPNRFPSFLRFDPASSDPTALHEELVCNAFLSVRGCDRAQPLEAMYRALVVRDPRNRPGNADANAGFVRDDALLALVLVTDEDDGSVRDCRYAERGIPCTDAVSVFDPRATQWSSPDPALRFYTYLPGSAADPTWPLDRYIDPARPLRGFPGLKPSNPRRVLFTAITGVPLAPPTRGDGRVDYDALLGRAPDGSDGYTAMSAEGPVSMRQRNIDPLCPRRVVPACRRAGSSPATFCATGEPDLALPARRIAEVARRFDALAQSGSVSSICRNDYRDALAGLADRIQAQMGRACLRDELPTVPADCAGGTGCVRTRCVVQETLPAGLSSAAACTAARGRSPAARDAESMRDACLVRELPVAPGGAAPEDVPGYFYDTRTAATDGCRRRITFTASADLLLGARYTLRCLGPETPDAEPVAAACE